MLISCLIKYSTHSTCIRSLTIVFHLLTDHLFLFYFHHYDSPLLLCRKRPWEILFPVVSNQVFLACSLISPFPFALFLSDEIVSLKMITTTILLVNWQLVTRRRDGTLASEISSHFSLLFELNCEHINDVRHVSVHHHLSSSSSWLKLFNINLFTISSNWFIFSQPTCTLYLLADDAGWMESVECWSVRRWRFFRFFYVSVSNQDDGKKYLWRRKCDRRPIIPIRILNSWIHSLTGIDLPVKHSIHAKK